ncbi:unnamed protein product [Orchesella dallaii]|uniref:Uncharacterized protein n=1 Tax=Orchesella dallaii TaxID=48710 RepID=A0ABP1RSM3_9HEXA
MGGVKAGTSKHDKPVEKGKTKDLEESLGRRNWADAEKQEVVHYLLRTVKSGFAIEKPNANAYYVLALKKLGLEDCTVSQLKNMVANLKRKYIKAIDWRNNTGQGVLDEEGEESVLGILRKRCPFFDDLEEIFGSRSSIKPPSLHDSLCPDEELKDVDGISETVLEGISHNEGKDTDQLTAQKVPHLGTRKRKQPESGMEKLASTAMFRFEVQQKELEVKMVELEQVKALQESKGLFEREKFEFDKLMAQKKHELDEKRLQTDLELAKYKIDQDFKFQLELAKLKNLN